jgi:prevent-host-death family protein
MVSLPLAELDRRTQELVEQVISTKEPALITNAEEPGAVVMPAQEYALQQQRLSLLERIARGKADLAAGRSHSQAEAERLIDDWILGGV